MWDSTPRRAGPIIKALQLPLLGWRLCCWLWLLAPCYELLHPKTSFLPYSPGPRCPLFPFSSLDWAGPAPVLPIFPQFPQLLLHWFAALGKKVTVVYILLRCSSFWRAAHVSPTSLSLPCLLMMPRTERSQSCHRDHGGINDKLPIRLLTAGLEHGGRSRIMVPSSDGCWSCPSIFVGIVLASVFLTRL